MTTTVVPFNVIPTIKPAPFANAAVETPPVITVNIIGPQEIGPTK